MDNNLPNFYGTAAQVIPTFLIAIALERGLLRLYIERVGNNGNASGNKSAAALARLIVEPLHLTLLPLIGGSVSAAAQTALTQAIQIGWDAFVARIGGIRRLRLGTVLVGLMSVVSAEVVALVASAFPPGPGLVRAVVLIVVFVGLAVVLAAFILAITVLISVDVLRRSDDAKRTIDERGSPSRGTPTEDERGDGVNNE